MWGIRSDERYLGISIKYQDASIKTKVKSKKTLDKSTIE